MAFNPVSYVKNVGKSLGYIALDVVKDYNPNIVEMTENAQDAAKDLYQTIQDFKGKINFSDSSSFGGEIKSVAVETWQNARDDFLSGKWYNKERKEQYSDESLKAFMGDDFDFDFDLDFDMDDDSSSSKEDKSIEQELNEEMQSTVESTVASAANTITSATVKSTEYIVASANANTASLYELNTKGFQSISSGLSAINNNLAAIASVAPALTTHMQNSTTFYTKSTENQEKIIKLLENINKSINADTNNEEKKSSGKRKVSMEDLTDSSGINFRAWKEYITDYIKNESMIGMMFGMAKDMGGGTKGLTENLRSAPIASMISAGIKLAMPNVVKEMSESINNFIPDFFNHLVYSLKGKAENSILGFISDAIFPTVEFKTYLKPRKYDKDKRMSWNGMAQQSLVAVIPFQLSRIISILTGKELELYNFKTGLWVKKKNLVKDLASRVHDTIGSADYDYKHKVEDIASKLKNSSNVNGEVLITAEQEKTIKNNIVLFFRSIMSEGGSASKFADFNKYFGANAFYALNNTNREELISAGIDEITWQIIKAIGKQSYQKMITRMNAGISSVTRQIEDLSDNTLFGAIYEGNSEFDGTPDVLKNIYSSKKDERTSAAQKLKEQHKNMSGGMLGNLIEVRDSFKHNIFDYLRIIAENTAKIRNIGLSGATGDATIHSVDIDTMINNSQHHSDQNNQDQTNQDQTSEPRERAGANAKRYSSVAAALSDDDIINDPDYDMPDNIKELKKDLELWDKYENDANYQDQFDALKAKYGTKKKLEDKYNLRKANYEKYGNRGINFIGRGVDKLLGKISKNGFDPVKWLQDASKSTTEKLFDEVTYLGTDKSIFKKTGNRIGEGLQNAADWLEDKLIDASNSGSGWFSSKKKERTIDDVNRDIEAIKAEMTKTSDPMKKMELSRQLLELQKEKAKMTQDLLIYGRTFSGSGSYLSMVNRLASQYSAGDSAADAENPPAADAENSSTPSNQSSDNQIKTQSKRLFDLASAGIADMITDTTTGIVDTVKRAFINPDKNEEKKQKDSLFTTIRKEFEDKGMDASNVVIKGLLSGGAFSLLTGGIVGPIVGASLGAGYAFIENSDTVQDFLFGQKDKDGKRANGKNSIFGEKGRKIFEKTLPMTGVGAGIGGAAGLLFGNPLLGAFLGSAVGFATSTDKFKTMIFGGTDEFGNEKKGLVNSEKFTKFVKDRFPGMAVGSLASLLIGPFGPVGNILMGSALGFATTSDKFKTMLFGGKDKDTGEEKEGLLDKFRNAIGSPIISIVSKLSNEIKDIFDRLSDSIKKGFRKILKKIVESRPIRALRQGISNIFGKITDKLFDGKNINQIFSGDNIFKKLDRKMEISELNRGIRIRNMNTGRIMTAAERMARRQEYETEGNDDIDMNSVDARFDEFLAKNINDKGTVKKLNKIVQAIKDPAKYYSSNLLKNEDNLIKLFAQIGQDKKYTKYAKKMKELLLETPDGSTVKEYFENNGRAFPQNIRKALKIALDAYMQAYQDYQDIDSATGRAKDKFGQMIGVDSSKLTDDVLNRFGRKLEDEKKAKKEKENNMTDTERSVVIDIPHILTDILEAIREVNGIKDKQKERTLPEGWEWVFDNEGNHVLTPTGRWKKQKTKSKKEGSDKPVDADTVAAQQRQEEQEEEELHNNISEIAENTSGLKGLFGKVKSFLFGNKNEEGKHEGGIFSGILNFADNFNAGWTNYIKPAIIGISSILIPAVLSIMTLSGKFDNIGAAIGFGKKSESGFTEGSATLSQKSWSQVLRTGVRTVGKDSARILTAFNPATATTTAVKSINGLTITSMCKTAAKPFNGVIKWFAKTFLKTSVKNSDEVVESMMVEIAKKIAANPKAAKALTSFASTAADAVVVVKIALAITDFITGMEDASSTLKVKSPNLAEKFICGALRTLKNLIPFVGGLIPDKWLTDLFIEFLFPLLGLDPADINERRQEAEEELLEYNQTTGKNLTWDQYDKQVLGHKNSLEKVWDNTKGLVKSAISIGSKIPEDIKSGKFSLSPEYFSTAFTEISQQIAGNFGYENIGESTIDWLKSFGLPQALKGDIKGLLFDLKDNGYYKQFGMLGMFSILGTYPIRMALLPVAFIMKGINGITEKIPNLFKDLFGNITGKGSKNFSLLENITNLSKKLLEPFQGIIDKIKGLVKPFTDQINKGAELINDPDATLADWFNMDDTGLTGIGSIFKPVLFGYRLMALPIAAVKNSIKRIDMIVSPLIRLGTAFVKDTIKYRKDTAKAVLDGDLDALWENPFNMSAEGTDTFGFKAISAIIEIGTSLSLTIPTAIMHEVHKVFDTIKPVIDGIKEAVTFVNNDTTDALMTTVENIRDGASFGQIISGLFNYSPNGNALSNVLSVGIRLMEMPIILTKGIGAMLGFAVTAPIAAIKTDSSALGEYITKQNASINEIESLKDLNKAIFEDPYAAAIIDPLGGVFNFAAGVITFGNFIRGIFKLIGNNLKLNSIFDILNLTDDSVARDQKAIDSITKGDAGEQKEEKSFFGRLKDALADKFSGKSNSGAGSGFISQYDSRYNNTTLGGKSIADNGCGPASAVMALNGGISMNSAINSARKYQTTGGTNIGYFGEVFNKSGRGAKYYNLSGGATGTDMINDIASGRPVVMMGQDSGNISKANSPFGPNNHYVVAKGFTKNGGVVVNDPELSGSRVYSPSILSHVKAAVSASGSSLRKMRMFSAGASSFITNADTQFAWNYFKTLGYSDEATAGIMGNIAIESSFNTTVLGDGGKAFGYCQWHDKTNNSGRYGNLATFAANNGYKPEDKEAQLGYINDEIFGGEAWAFRSKTAKSYGISSPQEFKDCKNVDTATNVFCFCFERPGVSHIDRRLEAAGYYYGLYSGKPYTPVNTSASTSTMNGDVGNTDGETSEKGLTGLLSSIRSKFDSIFGISSNSTSDSGTTNTGANEVSSTGEINADPKSIKWQFGTPYQKMKGILGNLKYSMDGPRNPDKGSADCSSTVNWAIKQAGGPDIGGNTEAQYDNAHLKTVWYNNGLFPNALPKYIKPNDILFFRRDKEYTEGRKDRVGHVGIYAGDNKFIDHGGKGPGPNERQMTLDKLIKVARVSDESGSGSGLMNGGAGTGITKDVAILLKSMITMIESLVKNTNDISSIYKVLNALVENGAFGSSDSSTKAIATAALTNSLQSNTQSKVEADLSDLKAMVDKVLAG